MITIIAGTNRADSMTLKTANLYQKILNSKTDEEVQVLSMENHAVWERGADMLDLEKKFLVPANKFVFVMPEYNASFPGILKVMMDNSDVKKCWWNKKAILVGISDGRAGNLRGIEHMTAILHYLKVQVHFNKLILSKVNDEISKQGDILKKETEALIVLQVDDLLSF